MKTLHTPAPWNIDEDGFIAAGLGDDYKRIADPRCMPPQGNEAEIDANAHLIAAAPDLLDALDWALRQIEDDLDPDHQAAFEAARSTLRKAKGE